MQRKVFGAELKAKVALEALAGRKTANEIRGSLRSPSPSGGDLETGGLRGSEGVVRAPAGPAAGRGRSRPGCAVRPDRAVASPSRMAQKRSGLNPPP